MGWFRKYIWGWRSNNKDTKREHNFIEYELFYAFIAVILTIVMIFTTSLVLPLICLSVILFINLLKFRFYLFYLFLFLTVVLIMYIVYRSNIVLLNQHIEGNFNILKIFNNSFIIDFKKYKVIVYEKIDKYNLFYNYSINLSGDISLIKKVSSFNLSENVFLELTNIKINQIDYYVNQNYSLFLNKNKLIQDYLMLILLNKYYRNSSLITKLKEMNIIHYFTISGFHFGVIYLLIYWILNKLKVVNKITEFSILIMLFAYLLLLRFTIGATRAFLFLMLIYFNKYFFNKFFNKITLLTICAILIMLFNPFIILSYSFILSFGITYVILIINKLTSGIRRNWIKSILVMFFAYLSSFFITSSFSDKFNLLAFVYQLFFFPVACVSYIFSMIFFWTNYLSYYYFYLVDIIIDYLDKGKIIVNIPDISFLSYVLNLNLLFMLKIKSRASPTIY